VPKASADFEEGPARAARPGWQPDLAQNFIRLERRRQIADEELFGFQYSLSPAAADDEVGVQRGGNRRQLRRGVRMSQAPTAAATIADLNVPDQPQRFCQKRAALTHQLGALRRSLADQRADRKTAVPGLQRAEFASQSVDVDEVRRPRQPEVQQRRETLASGQHLGV